MVRNHHVYAITLQTIKFPWKLELSLFLNNRAPHVYGGSNGEMLA
jgi:hypothetical protein